MTVRLAQDMGMPLIAEYAKRFGVYDDLLPVLAMSLGAGETTLLRMATRLLHARQRRQAGAADPDRPHPGSLGPHHLASRQARVQGLQGRASGKARRSPSSPTIARRSSTRTTAYQMTSIMEGVVQRGTATVIQKMLPNVPMAGKTGTTNEEKDAWFIGYTPDLVVGVFIGYDTPQAHG